MNDLLGKLQYTTEARVLVLNAPKALASTLEAFREHAHVDLEIQPGSKYGFVISFVVTLGGVNSVAGKLNTILELGDAKVWMAYPKSSSKHHKCEFNRDTGWAALGEASFEAVRQIAIDEDWSALRFRRVEFIKSMKRDVSQAISATGKARIRKQA